MEDFGVVALDAGGTWSLGGTVAASQTIAFAGTSSTGRLTLMNPSGMSGTITGFGPAESIVLAGVTDATGVSLSSTGNILTVSESSGPGLTLHFDPTQVFAGTFSEVLAGSGTSLSLSCFTEGTLMRTDTGLVPVERLRTGMLVRTHRGPAAAIVWVGHRHVDCRRHPNPAAVLPVRVQAGAFGPGLPARDLRLSPDHAVFVQDVLIPVRCLINGSTIAQVDVDQVTYYHLELPTHDVILAEDLPVESYLDTGDRANFANGGGRVELHPDFGARIWEMAGCAPLVQTGAELENVRRILASRPARAAA